MTNSVRKICDYYDYKFQGHIVMSSELIFLESLLDDNINLSSLYLDMDKINIVSNDFVDNLIALAKRNINISIFNLSPNILSLLFILKIDKYVNIFNNKTDALNSLNPIVKRRFQLV